MKNEIKDPRLGNNNFNYIVVDNGIVYICNPKKRKVIEVSTWEKKPFWKISSFGKYKNALKGKNKKKTTENQYITEILKSIFRKKKDPVKEHLLANDT